ncbi:hypothetical protein ACFVYJ_01370 [Pontibacter sp. JAM-7]|uniref:hypothetical protein n=1 Tax=Pontibacter sp. JAM-7 TaxID=3366581 RepID=UPI003AF79A58
MTEASIGSYINSLISGIDWNHPADRSTAVEDKTAQVMKHWDKGQPFYAAGSYHRAEDAFEAFYQSEGFNRAFKHADTMTSEQLMAAHTQHHHDREAFIRTQARKVAIKAIKSESGI